jgi:hypothetical protein
VVYSCLITWRQSATHILNLCLSLVQSSYFPFLRSPLPFSVVSIVASFFLILPIIYIHFSFFLLAFLTFSSLWIQPFLCLFIGPEYRSRYSNSLRVGRSGDPISVGMRFYAPVRGGPGAHPATYTMDTGLFPEVKLP